MPCSFCPPDQETPHPREPDTRCGRCGERLPGADQPGPSPGSPPRTLPRGTTASNLQSETFSLAFGLGLLFFGAVLSFAGLKALTETVEGFFILLMASPLLLGAFVLLARVSRRSAARRRIVRQGASTVGVVCSVRPSYDTSDGTTEGSVSVRYPTSSGWQTATVSNLSFHGRDPEVGRLVHVLYDAARPAQAVLWLPDGIHG